MSPVLLRFLIRRHAVSTSICSLIPVVFGVMIGLIYPSFAGQRALAKIFKTSIRFLGGGKIDLFSAEGAFSITAQDPLVLIGAAVIVAIPAMALPAGERGRGALDLLLATPLSRGKMIATVVLYQVALALVWGVMVHFGAWIGASMSDVTHEISWSAFAVVSINCVALCIFFAGTSLIVSVLARDRGQATLVFGVIVFLTIAVDITARLWPDGDWLRWTTPFGYMRPADALGEQGEPIVALRNAAYLTIAGAIEIGAALVAELRRRSV